MKSIKYLKNKFVGLAFLSVIFLFTSPVFIFADGPVPTSMPIKIENPFNCNGADPCNLFTLITTILNDIVMPIATVFIVVWIIYAGFKFVVAQGKPKELEEAKSNLLWALIGAGILLGAAGISVIVQNTINAVLH